MPKEKIQSFIDFFYPPFRKIMPLQTFRYAACGSSNVIFGFITYTAVYHFLFRKQDVALAGFLFRPYSVALSISSTTTFIIGFLLNKYVVFVESNLKGRVQLFRYFLSLIFNFCLNYVLLKLMVEVLNLNAVLAQLLATVVIIAVSYITQRHFTFRVKAAS